MAQDRLQQVGLGAEPEDAPPVVPGYHQRAVVTAEPEGRLAQVGEGYGIVSPEPGQGLPDPPGPHPAVAVAAQHPEDHL